MTSNLDAETSLTNHDIFELDESNEDNMEEEVEANNENGTVFFLSCVFNYFHGICIFFLLRMHFYVLATPTCSLRILLNILS
jgi:hypothetical protein